MLAKAFLNNYLRLSATVVQYAIAAVRHDVMIGYPASRVPRPRLAPDKFHSSVCYADCKQLSTLLRSGW